MFLPKKLAILATLVVGICLTNAAQAALIYSVELQGPTVVVAGQSFVLDAYLRETRDIGDTTVLGDPLQGLITGNFAIQLSGTGANTITAINGNAAFDNQGGSLNGPPVWELYQDDLNPLDGTPTGSSISALVYRLFLGSITVQASNVEGDTNTFTFVDPFDLQDDLVLGDAGFTSIDGVVTYGDFTVTASAVPEPSTMALVGLAALIPFGKRLRKKFLGSKEKAKS